MMSKNFSFVLCIVLIFSFVSGCATKKFVLSEIGLAKDELNREVDRTEEALNASINGVESRLQPQIDGLTDSVSQNSQAVGKISTSLQEVKGEVKAVEKNLQEKIQKVEKDNKKYTDGSAGVLKSKIKALQSEVGDIFSCEEKADRKKVRCESKCGAATDPNYTSCINVCAAKHTLDRDACACAARAATVPGV